MEKEMKEVKKEEIEKIRKMSMRKEKIPFT